MVLRVLWIALQTAAVALPVASMINYFWWKTDERFLLSAAGWVAIGTVYYLDRRGVRQWFRDQKLARQRLATGEPAAESQPGSTS